MIEEIIRKEGYNGNMMTNTFFKNNLKEKMKTRPVFGMTICSGSPAIIEMLGYGGLDFAFIDTEHNSNGVGDCRELILAARMGNVAPLVRVGSPDEVEIRKALELGAEGVIIPHIKTVEEMEACVRGAKFPPLGRRGLDFGVRSAGYGLREYENSDYISYSNDTELVIPMMEDFEFTARMDELMAVPGIDAINFGPADYANSLALRTGYSTDEPQVYDALQKLRAYCEPKGIGIMAPANPPTLESAMDLIHKGATMIIMSSDFNIWSASVRSIREEIGKVLKAQAQK